MLKRRNHDAVFKARVALDALKESTLCRSWPRTLSRKSKGYWRKRWQARFMTAQVRLSLPGPSAQHVEPNLVQGLQSGPIPFTTLVSVSAGYGGVTLRSIGCPSWQFWVQRHLSVLRTDPQNQTGLRCQRRAGLRQNCVAHGRKLMKKQAASLWLAVVIILATAQARAEESCGSVVIAEMKWTSAGLAGQVDKAIFEVGNGNEEDLIACEHMPTCTFMSEKVEQDTTRGLWARAVLTALDVALSKERGAIMVPIFSDGGVEDWSVPSYLGDAHHEHYGFQAALKRSQIFLEPEHPDHGVIRNCPWGWSSQVSKESLYGAQGAKDKGFARIDTGSAGMFHGSIANALAQRAG